VIYLQVKFYMPKKLLIVTFCLFLVGFIYAQNWYVAAKSGLSMRDKPDAKATVLEKIPYGTKLTITYSDATIQTSNEGMNGEWAKTTHNSKTGYVVNSYLLPWAPPKATVKTMKEYFQQLAAPVVTPFTYQNGHPDSLEADYYIVKKYLFKNGAEMHEEGFYESNNNNYFLPGFSIQQGFILARLIPEFEDIFLATDVFPKNDTTIKKGEKEIAIKVYKDGDWITRITADYEEGAVYSFSMSVVGGQLMISFGGGL
jgi:hypothetical protein